MKKILLLFCYLPLLSFGQSRGEAIFKEKDASFFRTDEARRIGEQVLLFQRCTGGWPKNTDMVTPLSEEQLVGLDSERERIDDSTIDNNATTGQMWYLARLYHETRDFRYAEAFRRGLQFLLDSQYPNGGWPQFWPQNKGYQKHITYNDGAMVNVLSIILDITAKKAPFDKNLVNVKQRRSAKRALRRGVDCILATQIIVDGHPTVWCQQHDSATLQPVSARAYELASFVSAESADIVYFLMQLTKPGRRVFRAVNEAMQWFERTKIIGMRLVKDPDARLVADSTATPLWARFYDLENCQPFVCDRDGVPRLHLEDIGRERRNGYSWYNNRPQRLYDVYRKWLTAH